jgi:predicted alpha-1,2-mannosidase
VNGRADVDFYLKNGYVSEEEVEKASSYTLSYSVDDYILAGLSKVVGKDDDATAAAERASNYKNIFDAERMLMCPRSADGTITCAEHPQRDFDHYTEGNALHWTYFVPHDVEGLKALYPSEEAFETQLIEFFDKHLEFQRAYGNLLPNPYFWAGNEPTMLTPWLFNYGKQCHLTQYWTRTITHLHFSNKASGLPGNDDYASMSTFLLFSSLGVYPAATKDYYLIGSPRVQSASLLLQRADGSFSTLSITTHDNSADNVYVQKLLVNGLEWTSTQLPTAVLKAAQGCTLEFFMGPHASSSLCQ